MSTDKKLLERVTLGTAGLGGTWRPVDLGQSVNAVLYALDQGVTHIDMAPAYMDAEIVVGKALKQWKGESPFLSTKIGKRRGKADQEGLIDYDINNLKSSLMTSLERVDLEQIDLLFLHEPDKIPHKNVETIVNTLLSFKEKGLIKKVGMGGAAPKVLKPYIEEGYFDVIMDFNGYNLVERKALKEDIPFYRKHNLEIYEGSPLMMGLLGRRLETYMENPPSWVSLEVIQRAAEMQLLASKFNMSLATMAHRYLLFSNEIDRMVIGPAVFDQLESTINDIQKGPLTVELLEEINNII